VPLGAPGQFITLNEEWLTSRFHAGAEVGVSK
jgi:hypothetical protein